MNNISIKIDAETKKELDKLKYEKYNGASFNYIIKRLIENGDDQ